MIYFDVLSAFCVALYSYVGLKRPEIHIGEVVFLLCEFINRLWFMWPNRLNDVFNCAEGITKNKKIVKFLGMIYIEFLLKRQLLLVSTIEI